MESIIPIAAFGERVQLSRRTIERKIASGEIAGEYVQRRGRRVFIDAAVLPTLAPNLSRHDATLQRPAAKPPNSPPELILTLRESLRRERERADRAEARAEIAEQERREVQRHLSEATKGIILLQRQLTPPVESPLPQPMTLSATHHPAVSIKSAGAPTLPGRGRVAFPAGGSGLPTDPRRAGSLVDKIKKSSSIPNLWLLLLFLMFSLVFGDGIPASERHSRRQVGHFEGGPGRCEGERGLIEGQKGRFEGGLGSREIEIISLEDVLRVDRCSGAQ